MAIPYLLICDDIRTEVGGKKTFVGVYPHRAIRVQSFPFRYPVLAFFLEIQEAEAIRRIEITVTPPKSESFNFQKDLEKSVSKIFVEARLENITIPEPGNIEVEILGIMKAEKDKWTHKILVPVGEMPKTSSRSN